MCVFRRSIGHPVGALTFNVSHSQPHLNRDGVYRILKVTGLNRPSPFKKARKPHGSFKD